MSNNEQSVDDDFTEINDKLQISEYIRKKKSYMCYTLFV